VNAADIDPWPADRVSFDREPGRPNDIATNVRIVERAPRLRGVVKFYAEAGQRGSHKAHGFVLLDSGETAFIAGSTVTANGIPTLKPQQRVEVALGGGNPRPFVSRIALVDDAV
jgi:cold shock CspA family protein